MLVNKIMKAGRLLGGEILATQNQVFCKLSKPIPQDGTFTKYFNFMIIAGEDVGKFAELPDTFEGTPVSIITGDYLSFSPFLGR
jgi:hypothetical protein